MTADELKTVLSQGRKAVQALNIAGNNPAAVSPAQVERMEKDISAAQHIIDMVSEPTDAAILQLYYLQCATWHDGMSCRIHGYPYNAPRPLGYTGACRKGRINKGACIWPILRISRK